MLACFDRLVIWLIVTAFLLTTSPTLFAQTDGNAATAGGRIAEMARTPALPGNETVTLGLRFDNHSIFGLAVSPKAGLYLRGTDFWRVRASYGRGFRAPDLGQLFLSLPQSDQFLSGHREPESAARIRAFGPGRRRAHFPQSPHPLRNALHDGEGAQLKRKERHEGHPASRPKPDATKLVK